MAGGLDGMNPMAGADMGMGMDMTQMDGGALMDLGMTVPMDGGLNEGVTIGNGTVPMDGGLNEGMTIGGMPADGVAPSVLNSIIHVIHCDYRLTRSRLYNY